jgi:preprotein translocase subunit Sec63
MSSEKMKKKTHTDIEEALGILGLDETASLEDLKKAYYELARRHHPDVCRKKAQKKCEEKFKKISQAYKTVQAYCAEYGPELSKKKIKKNTMGEEYYNHLKRFYDGWWGDLDL